MQKKIEMNINSLLFNLKKFSPKRSNLSFQVSDQNQIRHHSFQEVARKVISIKRSLSAMGYKFKILYPGRLRGGAISRVKLARLRQSLAFRVIVEHRNELKILFYSKQEIVNAPGALFSWFVKDFKSKMFLPGRMAMVGKLEEASTRELWAAKMNADIRGLVEIAEYIGDDIANSGDYEGTIKLVEEMKEFFDMQNTSIKNYLVREELLRTLEDRIKAGEDIKQEKLPSYSSRESMRLLEDDVHIDEELMHITLDMEVGNRYKRSHLRAQRDQLQFKTSWAENDLINIIKEYNLRYQREKTIFAAIEKANEHVINKLEDEVSVMSQKYEYECEEYDMEINRKKNEILASIDKLQTMQKKYEETKEEIGDQVPREVEPPTIWTVLEKLILIRIAQKKAEEEAALLRKSQKKKGKKVKDAAKKAGGPESDKLSEKGSEKASEKGSEKGSKKGGKKGKAKATKKASDKGSEKGSEKSSKTGSTKGVGKAAKKRGANKSVKEIEEANDEAKNIVKNLEVEGEIEILSDKANKIGAEKEASKSGKKAIKKGKEKENIPKNAEADQGTEEESKKGKPKAKKAK